MTKSLPKNTEESCQNEDLKNIEKKRGPIIKPNKIIIAEIRLQNTLKKFKKESERRQLLCRSAGIEPDSKEKILNEKIDEVMKHIHDDKQFYLKNKYPLSKQKN
jgi:hypothetical protein